MHGLGVDFGSSGVKAVALSSDGRGVTLLGAGREAIPAGAVEDGAVRDADAVGAALARLLDRLGVRCRRAALAIGGSSVLVKSLPAPAEMMGSEAGTREVRDAVAREAARHVPFHLESLEFDFEGPFRAPAAPGPGSRGVEPDTIVFGAAPRAMVQNHCLAAAGAGRAVTRIELEPYALHAAARCLTSLTGDGESGVLAIAEIGASRAGVHIFSNAPLPGSATGRAGGTRHHARADAPPDLLASVPVPGADDVATGGRAIGGQAIGGQAPGGDARFGRNESDAPEGPEREAWQAGRSGGSGGFPGRVQAAVREALREAGNRPSQLLVSGGGARVPGLETLLGAFDLGAPVVLDPLGELAPGNGDPAFAVAAGLAHQEIVDLAGPAMGGRP